MAIDLHTHTVFSDGADTPEILVENALSLNLKAVALTDHDTLLGIPDFLAAGHGKPIRLIPGVEISAAYLYSDIHILGYHPDLSDPTLTSVLSDVREERLNRNITMVHHMQELGYDITFDEVAGLASGDGRDKVISRLHFAKVLTAHGYTSSIQDAFRTLLDPGCPCYIPRKMLKPLDALELIRNAGGIPVLAHPLLYKLSDQELYELVRELTAAGLQGLEVIHSTISEKETIALQQLADEFHLHYTGGSDYHGVNKTGVPLGVGKNNVTIPDEYLEFLL